MASLEVPTCDKCHNPAMIHQEYSGRTLCGRHLADSIRKKVAREMRKQVDLNSEEMTTIFVAISGGKDSAVLLDRIVEAFGPRPDVKIVAGCVDEGIEGYRAPSLECARELAKMLDVEFITTSYPELGFEEMDEVVRKLPVIGDGLAPCSFCGVFRRQGINSLARSVNADMVALGHNLDDMAQTIMMNMQKGDVERTIRLAPHTHAPLEGMAPRIVPLRWIPEQEVHAYALHRELPFAHGECPHAPGALRWRHRSIIASLESDVPGTRHGLVHMADQVKQLHADAGGKNPTPPSDCPNCGELTSGEICKACEMVARLDSYSEQVVNQ